MTKKLNIAIIGSKFMGRSHSNAYLKVHHFFDMPVEPVMKVACGRNEAELRAFADQFGWEEIATDWREVAARPDIDVIDICTSNATHMPIAIEAAKHGKHVICEKPLAMDAAEARQMLSAAQAADVRHMVAFNYRRVPAIQLAKQMINEGKIGRVFHFNAVYYQDWIVDPEFSIVWRHDSKVAGSGAHGDMNAHTVDLARFLVGEITDVTGAQEIFIKERPLADGTGTGQVTADDATYFIARFDQGALGNFMATRFANGRKNFLRIELFGSKGSLVWNLERMNELEYYSTADEQKEQGFRNILVTENVHPYVSAWWPPGHIIGWEHTFIHEVRDLLVAIANHEDVTPNFYDGLRNQLVLDKVVESSQNGQWLSVPEK